MSIQQGQPGQLPPLRTFEITLRDIDRVTLLPIPGTKEGLEGHGIYVEDCGALNIRRFILYPWAQSGVMDQIVKTYAPGTWYSGADVSAEFKTVFQTGVKVQ